MKKVVRLFLFTVIVGAIMIFIDSQFMYTNDKMDNYYENQDIADVVVFGTSHSYNNINAANLFEDYGITAVGVGQPEQPICMTYYQMKECFQNRIPQLAIVEVFGCVYSDEYCDAQMDSHYSRLFLSRPIWKNFSLRLEASRFFEKDRIGFILGYPVYHDSFPNLKKEDYSGTPLLGGFNFWLDMNKTNHRDGRYSTNDILASEQEPVTKRTEEYLKNIQELCEDNGVKLIFLVTPYQASEEDMKKLKYVENVSKKLGVIFFDMNNEVEDMQFSYSEDMYDWGHQNIFGSTKTTRRLGRYLDELFDLPDRRNDETYSDWHLIVEKYHSFVDK